MNYTIDEMKAFPEVEAPFSGSRVENGRRVVGLGFGPALWRDDDCPRGFVENDQTWEVGKLDGRMVKRKAPSYFV